GYHSQEELQEDFAWADIFVMTSFAEGIPVVLMEAMAKGVPVVAPRITGIPELVEDGVSGLRYTPGVVMELIGRIDLLLADAERRNRYAEAGREVVTQQFNMETDSARLAGIIIDRVQRVYDRHKP